MYYLVNVGSPQKPNVYAKISPEDAQLALLYKWSLTYGPDGKYYVRGIDRTVKPPQMVKLHRLILKAPPEMDVDHINGDTLDNRRENLRLATDSQNIANARKYVTPTTSKYRGVSWHKKAAMWRATVTHAKKQTHLGFFRYPEDAAKAYDLKAKEIWGEYANLNFPILAGDVRKEMAG